MNVVRKKSILHVMTCAPDSTYKKSIVDFFLNHKELNENFENLFFYTVSKTGRFSAFINFVKVSKQADLIIVHGLFGLFTHLILLFPGVRKKTLWVIWGGDLYNFQEMPLRSIKNIIGELIRKTIIRNIKGILTIIPQDYSFAQERYQTFVPNIKAFYPYPIKFDYLDLESIKTSKSRIKTILVGNSASVTNNHFEVIDYLASLKKDIKFNVICPLSYGENVSQVLAYGKEKLAGNFFPLLDPLEPREYAKILISVDIAIMNHRRQESVGTIIPLIYSGKKVYIREEVSTYQWLTNLGVLVFDTDVLLSSSGTDIFEFSTEESSNNKKIMSEHFSEKNCVQLWKKVFEL